MTVQTTHISNSFTGNGATTVFNFTFQVLNAASIQIYLANVLQNTGFTLTLNQDQEQSPGGNVTFTVAPGNGVAGLIKRSTSQVQDVAFTRESLLNTDSLELVFDKLTMLLQEAAANTQGQIGPQGPQGPQGPSGTIGGPGTTVNNAIPLWNGTLGNLLKAGVAPVNDGDILKVVAGNWTAAAGAASIPSGVVMFWPFDPAVVAVPAGWALCNGQNVTINGVSRTTPDTRGKYVLGAAVDDTGSSGYTGSTVRPGTVSGTKTHQHANAGTITVANASAGGTITASGVAAGSGVSQAPLNGTMNFNPASHAHTASISGNTQANVESSRPIETALLLIIKVD